jgi:hypothetical protein
MGHARVDVDATQERARQFVANTSEATREMRRELGWNVQVHESVASRCL